MIKRYIILPQKKERLVVLGKSREYLVFENFCSCVDFQKNGLLNIEYSCKHILAAQKAKKTKKTEDFAVTSEEYRLLRRWFL